MLGFAYKWLGQKRIYTRALPDFPDYKENPDDDGALVGELWKLLDAADILVAHNGDRYDLRYAHARMLYHGYLPYDPAKSVDTLKVARRIAKFGSNKLDDLGHYLGLG